MPESPAIIRKALFEAPSMNAQPDLAHDSLVVVAGRILDMAEEQRRELTPWEKANVVEATGSLAIGWRALAYAALRLAIEDPANVSPNAVSAEHQEALDKITTEQMRHALAAIAAGPLVH
jgi:hypothetical protein